MEGSTRKGVVKFNTIRNTKDVCHLSASSGELGRRPAPQALGDYELVDARSLRLVGRDNRHAQRYQLRITP